MRTCIILALILCCLSYAATGGPRQNKTELKIAVNATTIESFPVFAAAGSGVQLVNSPNGRSAMADLVAGKVDAATGSETQALLNSVADPRLRIVLTLAECRYRIVARRSSGIQRVADLRGKAVAMTPNTSSQYFLSRMLKTAQLNDSDVRFVAFEGQDMPAALQKRTIDAVSIWEPHAQNSIAALGDDAVLFENESAYTERFNLNTRTDVLTDPLKRRAMESFIKEIARVSATLRNRPADLMPSLAPKIGLSNEFVKAVWSQFKFPATISPSLRTALNDVEPWIALTQKRQARSARDLNTLIDNSLIQR